MNLVVKKLISLPGKLITYTVAPQIKRLFRGFSILDLNSKIEKQFIKKLSRFRIKWQPGNRSIVLTQIISDYEMCIKFAAFGNRLALDMEANLGFYPVGTVLDFENERGQDFKSRRNQSILRRSYPARLRKIFLSLGGRIIFSNTDQFSDQKLVENEYKKIKEKIKSKSDVIEIKFDDITVGEFIYDAYLRMGNKPTLEITDPFLDDVIIEGLNIYYTVKEVMEKYNVVALLNSYASYIHHGIVTKLMLEKNIPVYTVGGRNSIIHKVNPEFPSHFNDHFSYPKMFKRIENKDQILNKYQKVFEKRFAGEIDHGTSYMKESAFSKEVNHELEGVDWNSTVVILAHCFFDSPHIYRKLLFPDFLEWIKFTIDELLKLEGINIIVKQHPNGLPQNDGVFLELKKEYTDKRVMFIDKATSQMQIINSRPRLIVTAYGTAAAEFAYQGLPVITIFDNPFTAYNFTYLASTIEEYREFLSHAKSLIPKQVKEEIIEHYYMQNFFFLNGVDPDYLDCLRYKGQTGDELFLQDYVPKMDEDYFKKLNRIVDLGFSKVKEIEKI